MTDYSKLGEVDEETIKSSEVQWPEITCAEDFKILVPAPFEWNDPEKAEIQRVQDLAEERNPLVHGNDKDRRYRVIDPHGNISSFCATRYVASREASPGDMIQVWDLIETKWMHVKILDSALGKTCLYVSLNKEDVEAIDRQVRISKGRLMRAEVASAPNNRSEWIRKTVISSLNIPVSFPSTPEDESGRTKFKIPVSKDIYERAIASAEKSGLAIGKWIQAVIAKEIQLALEESRSAALAFFSERAMADQVLLERIVGKPMGMWSNEDIEPLRDLRWTYYDTCPGQPKKAHALLERKANEAEKARAQGQ